MSAKPAEKKSSTVSAHPPYKEMAIAAIIALKDRKGCSRQAILKYIDANYKVKSGATTKPLNLCLKKGLESRIFVKANDSGSRYKLSDAAKAAAKKPATKKKPAAKTPKPKKPVAKTTKKPASSAKKAAEKKKTTKKAATPKKATKTVKKPAKGKTPKKASKKPSPKKTKKPTKKTAKK